MNHFSVFFCDRGQGPDPGGQVTAHKQSEFSGVLPPARKNFRLKLRDKSLDLGIRTRCMGVVNITPDSFSDGGRFFDRRHAINHCLELVEKGADLLDLGGESSRPGAEPVSESEELDRILPVLEEIRRHVSVPVSVDTYKSGVAEAAFRSGADAINDISCFRFDAAMPEVVSRWKGGIILMHMRGTPASMQKLPPSRDILSEICADLQAALETAYKSNIASDRILLDPGIGFGKTLEDNLRILNRLSFLDVFQLPVLIGTSRKSFIGRILEAPVDQRLVGSIISSGVAVLRGAHIVRVHDVEETRQTIQLLDAIMAERVVAE